MTRDERTRASAGAGVDAGSGSTARGNVSARWYTLGDRRRVQVATAGDRLVARVVDWGFLCIVGVAMLLLAGALSDDWEIEVVLVSIHLCVVLVGVLYEWILIATRGHTIGKFVAGVTVRRAAAFAARTRGEAAPPRPDCWHATCQVVATVGLCAALAGMIFLTHLINLVT